MAATQPSAFDQKATSSPSMSSSPINPPNLAVVLGPLLPALPAAALSTRPAEPVLQLLSPILRQRVQLLAASSSSSSSSAIPPDAQQQPRRGQQQDSETPWIRLLCYSSPSTAAQLQSIAQSAALELHPVSGEVEVDWDHDARVRYRRLDEETLQCLVAVETLGLGFRLVYCTEGWKVGEVTVVGPAEGSDGLLFTIAFGGTDESHESLPEAEAAFKDSRSGTQKTAKSSTVQQQQQQQHSNTANENNDDDDDDDYWARYDAATSTQATPQPPRTPAATGAGDNRSQYPGLSQLSQDNNDDDDYYAQYDEVQPAMDSHDPDEEMDLPADGEHPAYSSAAQHQHPQQHLLSYEGGHDQQPVATLPQETVQKAKQRPSEPEMAQPKPSRSNSNASSTTSVEKLEAVAHRLEQSEFGVKQHVSRTMKSLYMLARASGIDRQEFERMVQTELDILPMMDENE